MRQISCNRSSQLGGAHVRPSDLLRVLAKRPTTVYAGLKGQNGGRRRHDELCPFVSHLVRDTAPIGWVTSVVVVSL